MLITKNDNRNGWLLSNILMTFKGQDLPKSRTKKIGLQTQHKKKRFELHRGHAGGSMRTLAAPTACNWSCQRLTDHV